MSIAFFAAAGCAIDASDPGQASDDATGDELAEPLDTTAAVAIAKAKMSLVGADAIAPRAAACGVAGPTGHSDRVNDAAFHGAANQRSGSSTGCTAPGALQPTDDALYFCFTGASDGTWTYLQNLRTGVRGWTRDDLLRPLPGHTLGGSFTGCGF